MKSVQVNSETFIQTLETISEELMFHVDDLSDRLEDVDDCDLEAYSTRLEGAEIWYKWSVETLELYEQDGPHSAEPARKFATALWGSDVPRKVTSAARDLFEMVSGL